MKTRGEGKQKTKETKTAREIWSFQIKKLCLPSTNYSHWRSPNQAIPSQISHRRQSSSKRSMNIYICVCVCLCEWVRVVQLRVGCILLSAHTHTHTYCACVQCTIVLFVQWLVSRDWRRTEREAVPAGSIIPCGECWLMNHIFLTSGWCCAAALSQHCRGPLSLVPAFFTGTTEAQDVGAASTNQTWELAQFCFGV